MVAAQAHTTVLVVYVNFAVGSAIAHRLMEPSVVALSPVRAALEELRRGHYDVLLLCPYLSEQEREDLLEAAAEHAAPPAVVQLADDLRVVDIAATLAASTWSQRAQTYAVVSALAA